MAYKRTGFLVVLSVHLCIVFAFSACSKTSPRNNPTGSNSVINDTTNPVRQIQESPVTASTQSPPARTPQKSPDPSPSPIPPSVSPEKVKEADALYEQGLQTYYEFKYDEAIKYFDKAIAANPGCYKAFTGKGIALCFKGNYTEGIALIKKALAIKPDFANANYNLALGYKLQKDYDNSLIWFEKAIALDPKDTWSYYGISTIYADRNNTEKSLEYLKKAIELDPAVKDVAKSQDHYARMRNNAEFVKLTK